MIRCRRVERERIVRGARWARRQPAAVAGACPSRRPPAAHMSKCYIITMQEGREGNSHPGAKGRAKVAMMCGTMGLLAVAGSSATLRMHSAIATRRESLPLRSESHILENRLPSMVKRASRPFLYAEKLRNTPARWSVGKSFLGSRSQSSGASSTSTTTACRTCHVTRGSAETKGPTRELYIFKIFTKQPDEL